MVMILDTKFNFCFILYNTIILPDPHTESIVYNLVIYIYKKKCFKKSVAGECFLCLYVNKEV